MNIDFNKDPNGLVPVVIQNNNTLQVLMLGYMNEAAFLKTKKEQRVTFYSRSKNRLWTKGEESGNYLTVKDIQLDCDNDTLLIFVNPSGPTCHKGSGTCWNDTNNESYGFISKLEDVITNRIEDAEASKSYVATLFKEGINKIAQKVGEEAVEVIIEAKDTNDELFLNESADLLFHYLLLLQAKGFKMKDVITILKGREK